MICHTTAAASFFFVTLCYIIIDVDKLLHCEITRLMLLHPTDRVFQPAAMSAHILLSFLHDWECVFWCLQVRTNLLLSRFCCNSLTSVTPSVWHCSYFWHLCWILICCWCPWKPWNKKLSLSDLILEKIFPFKTSNSSTKKFSTCLRT